jgi:hypothetical protein
MSWNSFCASASTCAGAAPSIAFWIATPMMSRYSVTPTISGRPRRPIFSESWYAWYQSAGILGLALTSGSFHGELRATPTPARSSRAAFCLFVAHWARRYAASLFRDWEDTAMPVPYSEEYAPLGPAGITV